MKYYHIPKDVLNRFLKTPERIVWLTKILDIADENGEVCMSYQQIATMLGISKGTARHFIDGFARFPHDLRTTSAHFVLCNLDGYTQSPHDFRTISAQDTHDEKPKKRAVRKKPIEEYSLQTRATDAFCQFIETQFGVRYQWDGKNAAQLKRLLGMIKSNREARGYSTDDEGILDGFGQFCQYVYQSQDQFHIENFTIPHLVQYYNNIQLQQQARANGTQYSTRREQTDAALIQHQKESIANSVYEAQQRWLESQGKATE